jgi:hypothetical protein
MESEIIAVIVLWIIVGPLLYKTFKNLFFKIESPEDKKTREKVEKLKAESRDKASKMLKENELKLEKSRKKREAEGKFLFDAPSKDLEGAFAKRAAFFANQGLDMPYPSEEEIEQMKLEIESEK